MEDNPELIRLLLDHGAKPNHGREVIGAVTGNKQNGLAVIKLLEQHGADLHRVFIHHGTKKPINALSMAREFGKQDVVDYLLSKGATLPGEAPSPSSGALTPADEVVAYFREHFGPVDEYALIEIVPTEWPVSVHFIPSSPDRNHVTLFTTGMSKQPMHVPADNPDAPANRFAELFMQLPGDWPYRRIDDSQHGWPVHWLRSMARYPHQHGTWMGGPVTIVVENEAAGPIIPGYRFNSMLLFAEQRFTRSDGQAVQLYRLSPLYPEERRLEITDGMAALFKGFDEHGMPFVVDLQRPSTVAET